MKRLFPALLCAAGALSLATAAHAQRGVPEPVAKVDIPPTGPLPNRSAHVAPVTPADLLQPAGERWLSYHGDYSAQHHSGVAQINRGNVASLRRIWVSETNPPFTPSGPRWNPAWEKLKMPTAGPGLTGSNVGFRQNGGVRSSPIYQEGVLFYTVGQNAFAVDARTGKQLWQYIANNTGGISNRGLGISGDTLFMMANGGLTAIDANTGVERWRAFHGGMVVPYAPIVVRDHVYVSGGSGSGRTRAFLESRNVKTGEREWIWYSTPNPGEPGAETWPSVATMRAGGGSPWQPLSYDPTTNLLYFGTGNADPMKDGSKRLGDNLYTSTIVALDADTGKLAWHFQATPHDDHDYDATQVTVLFDRKIKGKQRKLLALAGRNGFLIVLDRTNGESVLTQKIFPEVNWSRFNRPNGQPEPYLGKSPQPGGALVFPSSEGTTNWPAPAYSPQTGLLYFNAVQSRSIFYPDGDEYFIGSFKNSLRAIDPVTGKLAWTHEYQEPYGIHARYPGVLSTAGGLIFTGDVSGNAVAFDARTGKILWHDELPLTAVSNAPISYVLDGKQYVAVGTGDQIVAYALP